VGIHHTNIWRSHTNIRGNSSHEYLGESHENLWEFITQISGGITRISVGMHHTNIWGNHTKIRGNSSHKYLGESHEYLWECITRISRGITRKSVRITRLSVGINHTTRIAVAKSALDALHHMTRYNTPLACFTESDKSAATSAIERQFKLPDDQASPYP
jgi:uncharacterized protein with HEPN domain